jgi:hypothetical protein
MVFSRASSHDNTESNVNPTIKQNCSPLLSASHAEYPIHPALRASSVDAVRGRRPSRASDDGQPLDSTIRADMEVHLANNPVREVATYTDALALGNSAADPSEREARIRAAEIGEEPVRHGQAAAAPSQSKLDFSAVRIHTGDIAAASARMYSASAYTAGNNIVFGQGQYRPYTTRGRQLIAHELSHVIQQHNQRPSAYPIIQRQEEGASHGGLIRDIADWVKEKFKSKETLDAEIATGLGRASKVFQAAELAEPDAERAKIYHEISEKLELGVQNAEKIINVKEDISLAIEFNKALKAAEPVDLAKDGPEGAKKLFDLMAVSGKIGKKFFPPPFNAYFDFLAQMKNLENVGRVMSRPHGDPEMWKQVEQ